MVGDFHVRRYRPTDAAAVWSVHEAAVADGGAANGDDPGADDLHDVERAFLVEGEFLVGEVPVGFRAATGPSPADRRGGRRVVAIGGLRPVDALTAELTRLRVHPRHRGRGFDRRLARALERAARGRGFERVVLDTDDPLAPADTLPESLGYECREADLG